MPYTVAGIDIHKKVLMVVVLKQIAGRAEDFQRRRFGTAASELQRLTAWLREQGVEEAVMESTAQYWKPVWYELEPHMRLQLAQAFSNRAPRGRKQDFRDAERLVRRLLAEELILSFVPQPEQRAWRMMTRAKVQLARDRVRLHNQLEGLLEEMRIKLSSVLSDLLGVSGLRILRALAEGEIDPKKLAALGSDRLHCSEEQLVDALRGTFQPMHRKLLTLYLDRLQLLDQQIAELNGATAEAMREHGEAVVRLAEVPGFGADSAQRVIAEVGVRPAPSRRRRSRLPGWARTRVGRRAPSKTRAAVRQRQRILFTAHGGGGAGSGGAKGSHFQVVFVRLTPGFPGGWFGHRPPPARLVWKKEILHERVRYIDKRRNVTPRHSNNASIPWLALSES